MNIAVTEGTENFFSRLLGWVAKAWDNASEAQAISALDEATIRQLAQDCGIRPEELVELAKAGPHSADEMIAMMKALHIDPTEVQLRYQGQFRDMQINCSHCASKGACRRDLADGTAPDHFHDYCANADHLTALRAEPDMLMQ